MTTQPADEDTLIQAARAERRQHRSGASMVAMLGVAVALGVAGCLLIFVPHLVTMLLPRPISLLLGASRCLSSSPWASSSSASPGSSCWRRLRRARWPREGTGCRELPELRPASVRSDTVPGRARATSDAPRGVVTLCETPGCTTRLPASPAQAARLRLSRGSLPDPETAFLSSVIAPDLKRWPDIVSISSEGRDCRRRRGRGRPRCSRPRRSGNGSARRTGGRGRGRR